MHLINLEKPRERFASLLLAAQAASAPINLSDDPGRPARIIDHRKATVDSLLRMHRMVAHAA